MFYVMYTLLAVLLVVYYFKEFASTPLLEKVKELEALATELEDDLVLTIISMNEKGEQGMAKGTLVNITAKVRFNLIKTKVDSINALIEEIHRMVELERVEGGGK